MSMHGFETTPGGVMTVEVGAITGAVVAWSHHVASDKIVQVSYKGSDEKYTVQGSPVDKEISLSRIVQHLTTDPGVDDDDNPLPTSLETLQL